MYKVIGGDGRQYGPAIADEIRHWLAQGRIHAQTLVQCLPEPAWRPLHTFVELLPPPPPLNSPIPSRAPDNPMALWGFILGLVSLFCSCFCCCGCPVNFLALLFSTIGLSQAQRDRDSGSKTLALVGLICSLLSIAEAIMASLLSSLAPFIAHGVQ